MSFLQQSLDEISNRWWRRPKAPFKEALPSPPKAETATSASVMPLPPSNFEILLISSSVPLVHLSTLSPTQQTYRWSSLSHSEGQQIFWRQKVINAAFDECKCLLYNSIVQSELLCDMYPFLDIVNGARQRCTEMQFFVVQKVPFLYALLRKICLHDCTRSWISYILQYMKNVRNTLHLH
jgi:hypothetical protein